MSFSHVFIKMLYKKVVVTILPVMKARMEVDKSSPVTTTNSNELKINTNLLESNKINVLFTCQHIQML